MHSRYKCKPFLTKAELYLYTWAIAVGTLLMGGLFAAANHENTFMFAG